MAVVALIGLTFWFATAFGLRSWIHWRRTGRTGFVGLSGAVGSAEWWGGALFVVALVVGAAAPVLALWNLAPVWPWADSDAAHVAGVVLFTVGGGATLWAQFAMGDAWRIGVDPDDRTPLVGVGPFRWVRNPIFSSMLVTTIGLALMVPNAPAVIAVVILILALEIHVRWVEEPYLTQLHGARYLAYAAAVGRFVPGVGRGV